LNKTQEIENKYCTTNRSYNNIQYSSIYETIQEIIHIMARYELMYIRFFVLEP